MCLRTVFFLLRSRRPQRSTLTETLFPYAALLRSKPPVCLIVAISSVEKATASACVRMAKYAPFTRRLRMAYPSTKDTKAGPATIANSVKGPLRKGRSEEHTSELQSLMRISYAVFCLKKQRHNLKTRNQTSTA